MRLFLIIVFVSLSNNLISQTADLEIKAGWLDLKLKLQNRSAVIKKFTSSLSKYASIKKQVADVKKSDMILHKNMDKSIPIDSSSISLTETLNNKVKEAIQKLFLAFDNNKVIKKRIVSYQGQLEGSENEIKQSANNYNDVCYKWKRKDLIFNIINQNPSN